MEKLAAKLPFLSEGRERTPHFDINIGVNTNY